MFPFLWFFPYDRRPVKRYRVYLQAGDSYIVPDDDYLNVVTVRTIPRTHDTYLINGDSVMISESKTKRKEQ